MLIYHHYFYTFDKRVTTCDRWSFLTMDYIHCMFHQRSGLLDQQSMDHNNDNAHLLNCIDLLSMSLSMWSPSFVDQSIYRWVPPWINIVMKVNICFSLLVIWNLEAVDQYHKTDFLNLFKRQDFFFG